jgi:hypothetical protein
MFFSSKKGARKSFKRSQRGQALVEYMLAVSVLAIALAVGFLYLSDSTSDSFLNTRLAVQQVYP